jgi:predicted HicB family RNase H-like nuclease
MPTDSVSCTTTVSLPQALADRAAREAHGQGISINTFLLAAIMERVQRSR